MKTFEFTAELLKDKDIDAAYIEFPFDTVEAFGKKGQVKVYVDMNGYVFRTSLAKMGHHCHCAGLRKEHREKSGIKAGDIINVRIWEDTDERTVEVPAELEETLLLFPEIHEFFHKMSYTHRKEYVEWITSAKKPETRINRMEKGIEKLTKMYDGKNRKKRK